MTKPNGAANYTVSSTGTLVYVPEGAVAATPMTLLTWVDRSGREKPIDAPPRAYGPPRVSPDGSRLAVGFPDQGDTEIWILDLARAVSETPHLQSWDGRTAAVETRRPGDRLHVGPHGRAQLVRHRCRRRRRRRAPDNEPNPSMAGLHRSQGGSCVWVRDCHDIDAPGDRGDTGSRQRTRVDDATARTGFVPRRHSPKSHRMGVTSLTNQRNRRPGRNLRPILPGCGPGPLADLNRRRHAPRLVAKRHGAVLPRRLQHAAHGSSGHIGSDAGRRNTRKGLRREVCPTEPRPSLRRFAGRTVVPGAQAARCRCQCDTGSHDCRRALVR